LREQHCGIQTPRSCTQRLGVKGRRRAAGLDVVAAAGKVDSIFERGGGRQPGWM